MRTLTTRLLLPLGTAALALALWPAGASAASTQVDLKGTLVVKHADVFKKWKAEYWYWLKTSHGLVKLTSAGRLAEDLGKARVSVHGTKTGSTVQVAPGGIHVLSLPRTLASSSTATGPVKLAVILFNFSNNTAQPYTVEQAQAAYFGGTGSLADYYATQSFGQVSVSGDVYGWVTIGAQQSGCNTDSWGTSALAAARQVGFRDANYDIVQFVFPSTSGCGWFGLG